MRGITVFADGGQYGLFKSRFCLCGYALFSKPEVEAIN